MNFTWSDGRKLTGITKGTDSISYTYDSNGLRNSKTVNGTTTKYYWLNGMLQGQKTGNEYILFLYDESGSVYGFILKNDTEESYYYYEFNLQGDIIGIIDNNGNKVVEYTYDEWGKLLSTTGTLADTIGQKNPLRYRGYYYDAETGFYYVSSRYYDPEIGRFISADSAISGTGESIQGYNLYAYCFNNPVNMEDPTGNWPKWVGAIVNTVKKTVNKITNTIKKTLGITVQVNKEEPTTFQYSLAFSYENGTGYNKNFDTGKPANLYKTIPNSISEITKSGTGIDININGYGGSIQLGNEKAVSFHSKNSSYELGGNMLGRTYFKYTQMTDSGVYVYHKVSINHPEIGAGVLLYIFNPNLALVGAGVGAGSLIAK